MTCPSLSLPVIIGSLFHFVRNNWKLHYRFRSLQWIYGLLSTFDPFKWNIFQFSRRPPLYQFEHENVQLMWMMCKTIYIHFLFRTAVCWDLCNPFQTKSQQTHSNSRSHRLMYAYAHTYNICSNEKLKLSTLWAAHRRQAQQIQFPFVAIRRWNNFFLYLFLYADFGIAHIQLASLSLSLALASGSQCVSSNNWQERNTHCSMRENEREKEPTTNWKTF